MHTSMDARPHMRAHARAHIHKKTHTKAHKSLLGRDLLMIGKTLIWLDKYCNMQDLCGSIYLSLVCHL